MPEHLKSAFVDNERSRALIYHFVEEVLLSDDFPVFLSLFDHLFATLLSQHLPNFDVVLESAQLFEIFL